MAAPVKYKGVEGGEEAGGEAVLEEVNREDFVDTRWLDDGFSYR